MAGTLITGIVGPQSGGDGQEAKIRLGRNGENIVAELHGKYAEQTKRNRLYYGVGASAGIALIVPATTGGHPTLWNPLGSGRILSLVRLELSYVSGTHAPTALEWAGTSKAGAQVATGAPILTATQVAAQSGLFGGPIDSVAIWSPTTNTFTAAPAYLRPVGAGLHTGAAATAENPDVLVFNYDGDFQIAPGNAISLCTQAATTTALFQPCLVWEEIDL